MATGFRRNIGKEVVFMTNSNAALILIAGIVVLITGAGLGALTVVVIGIRRVDRPGHRLTDDADTPIDAATRRVLGAGARTPVDDRNWE
jgi:hypothetical protein